MTGPELFLRYAWPCAEGKLKTKKISENDYIALKSLVKGSLTPPTDFLSQCFPTAVKDLEAFSLERGMEEWSLATVSDFWHHHRGSDQKCAVKRLVVFALRGNEIFLGLRSPAINFLSIPLKKGDDVFVHQGFVIEKA